MISTFHPVWRRSWGEGGGNEFDGSDMDFQLEVREGNPTIVKRKRGCSGGGRVSLAVVPDELP